MNLLEHLINWLIDSQEEEEEEVEEVEVEEQEDTMLFQMKFGLHL